MVSRQASHYRPGRAGALLLRSSPEPGPRVG